MVMWKIWIILNVDTGKNQTVKFRQAVTFPQVFHQRSFMVFSDTVLILVLMPRTFSKARQLLCHEGFKKKKYNPEIQKKIKPKC